MATVLDLVNGTGRFERWIRIPNRGYEPTSGLSRSHIYQLIKAGKIKSASLKQPGKLVGVRVVWLKSIMDYIERFAGGGEGAS